MSPDAQLPLVVRSEHLIDTGRDDPYHAIAIVRCAADQLGSAGFLRRQCDGGLGTRADVGSDRRHRNGPAGYREQLGELGDRDFALVLCG